MRAAADAALAAVRSIARMCRRVVIALSETSPSFAVRVAEYD